MPLNLPGRVLLAPVAATLAVALVPALAGCGDSSGPSDDKDLPVTPPSVSDIPTLDTVRHLRLPSEAYKPTAAEQSLVTDATEKLIAECMSQFGFTWTAKPSRMRQVNQADRAYGVADLTTAQKYGYRLPPTDNRSGTGDKDGRQGAGRSYSPSELLVLTGSKTGEESKDETKNPGSYQGRQIPAGGCAAQSRKQVTGVNEIDPSGLADSITAAMWQKSKSDQRVIKVIKEWSACMRESGHNYPSPVDVGDPKWSSSAEPSAAEIQTAVTDVKCKQRTNLIGVWFSVESGYEKQAIQQNIEQLTRIKKLWSEAARKAARLLGRPAPQPS